MKRLQLYNFFSSLFWSQNNKILVPVQSFKEFSEFSLIRG